MSEIGYALRDEKGWAVASLFRSIRNKFSVTKHNDTANLNSLMQIPVDISPELLEKRLGRKNLKEALKTAAAFGGVLALMAAMMHPAFATDLLSSQDSTVTGTFGHGSSLERYFYYAEIIMALFGYIKSRSPLIFVGLVMVIIFTRIGFGIAAGG